MKDLKLFRILLILSGTSAMYWDIIVLEINHYPASIRLDEDVLKTS